MKLRNFLLIISIIILSGCWNGNFDENITNDQPMTDQFSDKPENNEPTSSPEIIPEKIEIIPNDLSEIENEPKVEPKEEVKIEPRENEVPDFLNSPVLFVSQAPYSNWDELHEEACEEAAMIMAVKYFKKENLSAHIMEQGILNLIKWEEANGYKVDLNANEAVEILKSYFTVSAEATDEVTVEEIKKKLLASNLIVVPSAGRQLGNPNFTGDGPIYHMLVIRGYDDKTGEFITNDPGTRKGEGYRYKYQKLIDAVHDWNHALAEGGMTDEEMEQGRKVVIVVSK